MKINYIFASKLNDIFFVAWQKEGKIEVRRRGIAHQLCTNYPSKRSVV